MAKVFVFSLRSGLGVLVGFRGLTPTANTNLALRAPVHPPRVAIPRAYSVVQKKDDKGGHPDVIAN